MEKSKYPEDCVLNEDPVELSPALKRIVEKASKPKPKEKTQ